MRSLIDSLIKRYGLEDKRPFLENVKIVSCVLHKSKDEVIITLASPEILSFTLYSKIKEYFEELIEHDVSLFIEPNESNLVLNDVIYYLKDYSKDHASAFRSALPLLIDGNLDIHYDQKKHYDTDRPYFCDLMSYLHKIGLKTDITFSFEDEKKEKEETLISAEEIKTPKKEVQTIKNSYVSERPYTRKRRTDVTYRDVRIDDLVNEENDVAFEGEIFKVDTITTKKGKDIVTLYVKDEDNALIVKVFEGGYFNQERLKTYRKGVWIKASGNYRYDDFSKDYTFTPDDIEIIEAKDRLVDDEADKRVELHAHTNRSEMDGVCKADEIVEAAFSMGHKAVAITDHYGVQAFPTAQKAAKACLKSDPEREFKILYGVEMAMVDKRLNIVYNKTDDDISDARYVVFDIETTGLSSTYDHIIEFGAVTMYRGNIESRIDMFIKPPVKLSNFTTHLTHIKDSDLVNARSFAEVKDEILDYVKGKVLVAHNASFDYGFINAELKRIKADPIDNVVIDTLDLARAMFKDQKRFRLGSVAKHFGVEYDESDAHRADYDAEVLAQVFNLMLKQIKEDEIKTFRELDDYQDIENAFKKKRAYHVTALAKNKDGLKDLFKMISIAHTKTLLVTSKISDDASDDSKEVAAEPRTLRETIKEYRKDLLIGSACLNGEVFEIASTRSQEELEEAIAFYDYIEVQPLENYRQLYEVRDSLTKDKLKLILKNIIQTAKRLGKIVCATGDLHYVKKDEKILRDVYITAKGIGSARHPLYVYDKVKRLTSKTPDQRFLNTKEMLEAFSWLEDEDLIKEIVITNTNKIADMCEVIYPIHSKLYTPTIKDSDKLLTDIVYTRAKEIYGEPLDKTIDDRLKKELDAIIGNGYGVIYYVSHLLVKRSNEDGYLVGSRGSVGSSLVATMAGITEVNPLAPHYICPHCKHLEWVDETALSGYNLENKVCPVCGATMRGDGQDIPFETFLGFNGDKVPDIDLNFSGDYQKRAHLFTREVFGEDHVFRAGTISTVMEKTAYGYVNSYLDEYDISKDSISKAQKERLVEGCLDVKRTTGQHAGGIIVIPSEMDVYDFTPIQYPANDPNATWYTTHFDFHEIHDNVLKFDILGHVDPTAMRLLQNISGIDPKSIPMNDKKTISIFSSAEALNIIDPVYDEKTGACGLPEFGTRFVRGILEMTRPTAFSDLVQISGLSHGTDVWNNNAKDLVEEGIALRDVIGCRDDIMVTMLRYGLESKMAFDIMEKVRKGKGLSPEQEEEMLRHDVPKWYIDSCKKIKYMFPKAHAVAYVIMAVRIAWFKVYHPEYYYVSYLSLRCDAYDLNAMLKSAREIKIWLDRIDEKRFSRDPEDKVSDKEKNLYDTLEICYEMKARGYDITNIDIERSLATEFLVDPDDDHLIIPPFTVIDGLGANVAESIVQAREERPFSDKQDLTKRTLLSKTLLKRFEELGILDGLDESDQLSLF